MPCITVCPKCGKCYEEVSEEAAHAPDTVCLACHLTALLFPQPVKEEDWERDIDESR